MADSQTRWSTLKNYCGYDSFFLLPPELLSSSFFPSDDRSTPSNSGVASPLRRKTARDIYRLLLSLSRTRSAIPSPYIFYSFNRDQANDRTNILYIYIYISCDFTETVQPIILIHKIRFDLSIDPHTLNRIPSHLTLASQY